MTMPQSSHQQHQLRGNKHRKGVSNIAIPKTYTEPDSKSNYTKLTAGKHRLRVLGDAITGWVWWLDTADGGRKPVRVQENETVPVSEGENAKKFMAFPIFNYATGTVQVWEVTQKSIKRELLAYEADPDWGDLKEYDIEVTREGTDLQTTKYRVTAKPKNPLIEDLQKSILVNGLPELRALYLSQDPFTYVLTEEEEKSFKAGKTPEKEEVSEEDTKDLPF